MTDTPKSPPAKPKTHRDRRAEALQKALRENLRRRKAAAVVDDTATPDGPPTSGDDHEKAREKGGGHT